MKAKEGCNDTPLWMRRDCPLCDASNWSNPSDEVGYLHRQNGGAVFAIADQPNIDPSGQAIRKELDETKCRLNALEDELDTFENRIKAKFKLGPEARRKSILGEAEWKETLAGKTTIHGLKEVLTENQRTRLYTWVVIFLTATTCTGWYMKNVFMEYMDNPTATKVKILKQEEYEYPVILLCPNSWLDASKAYEMNLSVSGLQYALGFLINYGVNKAPYTILDYPSAKKDFETWWYDGPGSKFDTVADFLKHISLDAEDFVATCSYCESVEGPLPFAKIIMNEAVCYNLSLSPTDGRVALSDLEYLNVRVPSRSQKLLAARSYWRFIVNPDLSLGMSETHYLQVFPNHSNTIRIMTHHFKSLPNSRCITQDYVQRNNYSQSSCVADCFTATSSDCHPYPLIRSTQIPKNVTKLCNTAKLVAKNVLEDTETKIVDTPPDCIERCPSLCEKWVYESSVESHALGAEEDEQGITSFKFLNQAVHYGGILSHEEVLTYSFETLVSNIGGQMGLWLGASLMSWVELIMFLLSCLCERKRQSKKKQKETQY